ncbi:MAG: hypothetical protein JEZ05_00930 [Tenericutes bacterium]|nr:hypothetical protein [Mycoplasmatota bacterium]
MRKYLVIIISLALTFVLVGCTEETTVLKLETPSNLEYNGVLEWDNVEGAVSYDLYLNEELETVNENMFVFDEEGTYSVYIIAKASGYLDSDPSATINVEIDYEAIVDFNISVEDNVLSWNDIIDAASYIILVNGTEYEIDANTYSLINLVDGVNSITIQAVYPIGVSNVSDIFYVASNLIETGTIDFQYSKNSVIDIIIWEDLSKQDLYLLDIDEEFIDLNSYISLDNEHIEIKSSALVDLGVGVFRFYLVQGTNKTLLQIDINDKVKPYIISSTNIATSGEEDIYLQFELFDGEIYSINGTREDTVQYQLNENILMIEKEFISSKFESNTFFILSYVINIDDSSVIGYLNFNQVS